MLTNKLFLFKFILSIIFLCIGVIFSTQAQAQECPAGWLSYSGGPKQIGACTDCTSYCTDGSCARPAALWINFCTDGFSQVIITQTQNSPPSIGCPANKDCPRTYVDCGSCNMTSCKNGDPNCSPVCCDTSNNLACNGSGACIGCISKQLLGTQCQANGDRCDLFANQCKIIQGGGSEQWLDNCHPDSTCNPPQGQKCNTNTWTCDPDSDPKSTCGNCAAQGSPPCYNTCSNYLDPDSCQAGGQKTCHFVSRDPNCADKGAWDLGGGCIGSCSACSGGGGGGTGGGDSCSGQFFCNAGQCRQYRTCGDSFPVADNLCNKGAGCAGGSACTLGNGAGGCDDGSGRCCLPGLECKNNVCTKPKVTKACDPLGPAYGSPPNGSRNMPTSVTFTWGTRDDAKRGACSNSGRYYEFSYGKCQTSSYNQATCVQEGSANGISKERECIFVPDYPLGYPGTYTANGLSSGWHYWTVTMTCQCHQCDGGAPPQGIGYFMFEVGAPGPPQPIAPTLICQANNTSGQPDPYSDICDTTQGSPSGYGSLTRHSLTALDNGPGGPRQAAYQHRYYVTDITGGTINPRPIKVGPNRGANLLFNYEFGARGDPDFINGHTYRWYTTSYDAGTNPINPTPESLQSATWQFLYDISPPLGSISGVNNGACYDISNPPPPISINALDPVPLGGLASLVKQVQLTTQVNNSAPITQDITSSCNAAGNNPRICNPSTSFISSAQGNIYTLTVNSTDNAGNNGTSAVTRFIYKTQCIGPWLQTTGGGVFTNDKINTPGGPP